MSKPDGGPAFPRPGWEGCTDGNYLGMSLRDWFAGMVLQGRLSNPAFGGGSEEGWAREAYRYADAMIAEREKA